MIRRIVRSGWRIWEHIFCRLYHLQDIPSDGIKLLKIGVQRYRGKQIILHDKTEINPGDIIASLHLNSEQALLLHQAGASSIRTGIKLLRHAEQAWEGLKEMVERGDIPSEVKAFYGVTLFYRGLLAPGMEVREASAWTRAWQSLYLRWLMVLYHPAGWQRLKTRKEVWVPKEIWISKRQLLLHRNDAPQRK
ncbi:hypothetical protein LM599_01515 [Candidatus Acetothermia bacterium]|jgi:hypothetical protein|nr:hypothetical protein [Candidatus Acetothermia bacterium]MCI2427892.1 hypothetical protein [Candidatus Acetothermia bacterium]MCI2428893.1 hypothetical protein [Candidatus Acetothermia bacterium]